MPLEPWIGQVMFAACSYAWKGTMKCNGSLVSTTSNFGRSLNSLAGKAYGGNGTSNVAVPDLRSATPVIGTSTAPIGTRVGLASGTGTKTLGLTSMIATEGVWPTTETVPSGSHIGEIFMVACDPANLNDMKLLVCDGRLLPIELYWNLFNVIGTRYGGDGVTYFALPDLRNKVPQQPKSGVTPGAQTGSGSVSTLAFTFVIVTEGVYPSRNS